LLSGRSVYGLWHSHSSREFVAFDYQVVGDQEFEP
jgi:hypothetical protein